jgi:hypothetical protein
MSNMSTNDQCRAVYYDFFEELISQIMVNLYQHFTILIRVDVACNAPTMPTVTDFASALVASIHSIPFKISYYLEK